MGRGKRFAAVLGTAAFAMLLDAGSASATFHLTKVREISPGNGSDNSYVEVQMYAPFPNFLSNGAKIAVCNNTCSLAPAEFSGFSNVANGNSQDTVLFGDTGVPSGSKDFNVNLNLQDDQAGGAVCYVSEPGYSDCVSWGNFSANSTLTMNYDSSAAPGTPAPALTSGMALRRSISAACRRLWRRATTPTKCGRLRCHDPQPAEELGRAHGDCLRPNRPDRVPGATEFPGHGEEDEVQEAQAEPGFRQRRHRARQRQHSGLRGQEEVQEEAEVATRRPAAACLAGR